MSATVPSTHRFTTRTACPICTGGHDLPSGQGIRCYGYLSSDGRYAHCTREERAGNLLQEMGGTYAHRLDGPCRCGLSRGATDFPLNGNGHAPSGHRARRPSAPAAARPPEPLPAAKLCPPGYREARAYPWPDAAGVMQFETVRYEHLTETQDKKPDKPKKLFKFRRPVPDRPGWYLPGKGDAPLVVFRKDRLAARPGDDLHVAEGEEHALALEGLGFLATTTAGGAGMVRAYPVQELQSAAAGRHVVLHTDNDDDGERWARTIADAILPVAESVRFVRYGDFGPGGDVLDAIRAGATAEDIERLVAGGAHATRSDERDPAAAAAPRLRFITAREFAQQTPEETEWVADPYVALGGVTKIDGPPKKAGKTTLITYMIAAILDGADFLGKPTRQGPVVLLTEQGGTSFREALARAGLLERDDLHLALYRDLASLSWPDVAADAFAKAREVGAVLLVVDTLPAISGVRGDDENSAGRALEALEPLQVGADTSRLGVIVSFHDRKGGGEVGESGRGSSAYAGAVDIILHVNKPGGNLKPTVRKIEALSRFEATPEELYVELTNTGYVSLGSEGDVVSAALARVLINVLPDSEEAAKRVDSVKDKETDEITERGLIDDLAGQGIKVARSTLDLELKRWVAAGYAQETGAGKRGSPHRYWLLEVPPDAFFRSKPPHPSEESIAWSDPPSAAGAPASVQIVSSNAPTPSEESNGAVGSQEAGREILSSDGPDVYIGRTQATTPPAGTTQEWL